MSNRTHARLLPTLRRLDVEAEDASNGWKWPPKHTRAWALNKLEELGMIESARYRGVWRITPQGRRILAMLYPEDHKQEPDE